MIRVQSITITEFRGVRDLTLDLAGKNFAICGPNGTGKSGVVDALEFVLTGDISRLTGEGRGDISLRSHAPHVDSRDAPERAAVSAVVAIPSLRTQATITRSVKQPRDPVIDPNTPEVIAILKAVEAHPEFVLSRRELIRYVLATPGKRAEEVQSLLHLDEVESVRRGLLKIANAGERTNLTLKRSANDARDNLLRALGITELTKEKALQAANRRRAILGLAELTEVRNLKDGVATVTKGKPPRVAKTQATLDLKHFRETIQVSASIVYAQQVTEAGAAVEAVAADPWAESGLTREDFYAKGLDLIEGEICPLCDTTWNPVELRELVRGKIEHLSELRKKRTGAETKLAPIRKQTEAIRQALVATMGHGENLSPVVKCDAGQEHADTLKRAVASMDAFLPLKMTQEAIEGASTPVPDSVLTEIRALEEAISALPDPSREDAARDWLAVAQERLEVWREAARKAKTAAEQADRAKKLSDAFSAASDRVLGGLYAKVERYFSQLYAAINNDDESSFEAKLKPSMGKLGFDVDFYGRGKFPPGAYHSEGHQDGMGLCLYLALMKYLQGESFTFAVLDDVLMSVDADHRREVCTVLKREFPNTQFVLTTHDSTWLRHMKTEQLIAGPSSVQFRSWDVSHGPTQWSDRDVWDEIGGHLNQNDVRAASGVLRHYLEYIAAELCIRLRAPVEFRGDGQYLLGELLPPAVGRLKDLYRLGKDAANSWNQKDKVADLASRSEAFGKLVERSNLESWQVNAAIHYNAWANLGKKDFTPVATAYRELLDGFGCPKCRLFPRLVMEDGKKKVLQCDCGETSINLVKKAE